MVSVLLIGGTSHAGKSTLGRAVAERFGWRMCSTDYLARHPGRPWRNDGTTVPPHVIEHFTTHSVDELVEDVVRHYRSVWPQVENLIKEAGEGLVVEGSAVLPELATRLNPGYGRAVWLIGEEGTFQERIFIESRCDSATGTNRAAIEMFGLRSERFNEYIRNEVQRSGLQSISAASDFNEQMKEVLTLLE